MIKTPVYSDIEAAHSRIEAFIHRTPVMRSTLLDKIAGASLFFKCENFQKAGAFKYRGATNAILSLPAEKRKNGVVTHSSGNHAGALAKAASVNSMKAFIVMPSNAPLVKKNAVRDYGAEITFCEPTLKAREESAAAIIEKTGATLIHPYDNFAVVCGQGTAALELLSEIPQLDAVIAPVGGGGLMSGTLTAIKLKNSTIAVFGAEPSGADDALRSLKAGKIIPSVNPVTIADGLLTSLCPLTFRIISTLIDDILPVSEKSIAEAMQLVWERMKILIEPSAAVPFAALLENREKFSGRNVGIILSGGNADLLSLPFQRLF